MLSTSSTADPSVTSDEFTGGMLPDGAYCMEDFECLSGHCYVLGVLGGTCGECSSDSDCPTGGCSPPNPLTRPPIPPWCNHGQLGEGCQSDDACDDALSCAFIFDIPGVITGLSCSQCGTDADCGGNLLCSPDYDLVTFGGAKLCVAPGSQPLGKGCDLQGTGDNACASGICAAADFMGILQLGVCSECETDEDCPLDQTCTPAQATPGTGLFPGQCT